MNHRLKTVLPLAPALAIALLTLTPVSGAAPVQGLSLEISTWRGFADVLINFALFLPLGAALARTGHPLRKVLLLCAAYSLTIEVLQVLTPGRYSSLGDLVFNTLGAAAGVWLVTSRRAWIDASRRHGPLLSMLALAAALIVAIGGAFLLQPGIPRSAALTGQWTPDLPHMSRYHGEVLAATVADIPVPPRPALRTAELRGAIVRGDPVRVTFIAAAAQDAAPVFRIFKQDQNEVFMLAADGADALVRVRARSKTLYLDQADFRFRRFFAPLAAGDTVQLSVARDGPAWCIAMRRERACHRLHSPGWTWALLLYSPVAAARPALVAGAWLLVLFVPTGAWLTRPHRALATSVTAALALFALPPLFWHGPVLPAEALAGATGVWLGFLLRRGLDPGRSGRAETAALN